nr:hypothetical protein [Psychrobacter sp. PraFG1]UNK06260.1 hypothetical protein MN210_06765 [Psychrobacter sp. PraFG1]
MNLQQQHFVTQSDNIFCAAGGSAFYDLALLLIERYCGREISAQVAKTQVIDKKPVIRTVTPMSPCIRHTQTQW